MKKTIFAVLISVSIAVLALPAALAAPAQAPVLAITRTPVGPFIRDAEKAALSNFYKREQSWLNLQVTHLQQANQVASTAQQLIDAAKAEGKDTSALETALAQFNADIAQAQVSHDNAANILASHSGFDGSGNVTDIQAAYHTVVDARVAMRNAHGLIVQAVTTLRQAIITWRQTH